jgi:hypothetical protein
VNLFLLSTPLQVINAIEAIDQYEIGNEYLIIYYGKINVTKILERFAIKNYMIFNKSSDISRWLLLLLWFRKISKMLTSINIERIFLGEFRVDIVRGLVNSLKYKSIVLIDEGFGTLEQIRLCTDGSDKIIEREISYKALLRKYLCWVLKINSSLVKIAEVFTVYKSAVEKSDMKLSHNDYRKFKQLAAKVTVKQEEWIVGNDYCEHGLLTKSDYFLWLNEIAKITIGRDVLYFPHPRENEKKLDEIARKHNHWKIKRGNYCLEHYIFSENEIARTFYGFGTAFLVNIKKMFMNKIEVYYYLVDLTRINQIYIDRVKEQEEYLFKSEIFDEYRSQSTLLLKA